MKKYDLVIFDCDGTLVDSELLNNSVTADMIAEAGLPQYDTQYCLDHFAGITLTNIIKILEDRHKVKFPDNTVAVARQRVRERMAAELKTVPDAVETVREIAARYKACVASNGERGSVLQSLELAGLSLLLPETVVFTANMVKHPKPAADLFLLAAREMGADPKRCLVIEDSKFGLLGAVTAGMDVLGIVGLHHDPDAQGKILTQTGAMAIIHHLPEIKSYLEPGA